MGLSHWDLWVAAIGIVGVLLAIVLRFTFARKRRASDHPSCRKCGHDLFGLPETSTRCPECGTDLTAKRAVLPHILVIPSARRWVVRAMLLVALILTFWAGWAVVHNPAYTQYKPSLVLVFVIETAKKADRIPATELRGRLERGEVDWLSIFLIRSRVVEWSAHKIGRPILSAQLSLLPTLHHTRKISDEEFVRLVDQLLILTVGKGRSSLTVWAWVHNIALETVGFDPYTIEKRVVRCTVDGIPVDIQWTTSRGSFDVLRWDFGTETPIVAPGTYDIELIVDVNVVLDNGHVLPVRTNHTLSTTITIPDPATSQPSSTP